MMLTSDQRHLIGPYVSNVGGLVFALSGLPEEVIAVLFAYYSRSRDDLRTSLARLLSDKELAIDDDIDGPPEFGLAIDKARAFHEKWVVGYGHASVAEHAIVHLAIEGVSILASKEIEDLRLASFTEKSTRYVVFTEGSFHQLCGELPDHLGTQYVDSCRRLFRVYLDLIPKVTEKLEAKYPKQDGQTKAAYESIIRARALDLVRGLLPASTLTSLGLTANARTLAAGISKLGASKHEEVRGIARQMRNEGASVVPTLLKYSEPNQYRSDLATHTKRMVDVLVARARSRMFQHDSLATAMREFRERNPIRFVRHDDNAAFQIALALVCDGESPTSMADELTEALGLFVYPDDVRECSEQGLSDKNVEVAVAVVRDALLRRGPHDGAPRAFEHANLTLEMDIDYGAYRDLARHRMLSPAHRLLTCELGYVVPEGLVSMGLDEDYRFALDEAERVWRKIHAYDPQIAQYAVPLAYRTRVLWTMNLREAIHVIELRSGRQGHASYRTIAQNLYRSIQYIYPWLSDLIRVDLNSYEDAR